MKTRETRMARRLGGVALVTAVAVLATGCLGTWGIRTSYRNYVTSPIAGGAITTVDGVTWLDGPGSGKGPFQWTVDYAVFDDESEIGTVQFRGGVRTMGHPTSEGSVIDTAFWNPRLDINGDAGTLFVDLNYRPFAGTSPEDLASLDAATDVPFATVDLSGVDWTPGDDGAYRISAAPMTGIGAAMELIGWDEFYGTPVTLDPLTVTFDPVASAPTLASTPQVTVSETEGLEVGDTITVWGRCFDPAANLGARPPLAGQPAGVYVVQGRFAPVWKPSVGAPSASRSIIAQKWALPPSSRAILDPAGTNATFATIDAYGRFEVTIELGPSAASGIEGIYVFPGSGAVNASHELSTTLVVG